MRQVVYGMIGFGGIAENRIAKEGFGLDASRFQQNAAAKLKGAFDVNQERRKAAEALHIQWYDSLEALLADPQIEAVFVTTNNKSHAPLAEAALQAGKHCIVEKPIAVDIQYAKKLIELAESKGLSIAVDHMMTKNAYNNEAKSLIQQQAIGEVNDITVHMEFLYGASPEEAASWRCSDPEEIGGPLGDVGCHCLYMAEELLDSPIVSLACVYLPRTLDIAVENGAFIQFKTENGISGSARVAFNQARGGLAGTLTNLGYEAYGTEGALRGFGTMFQLSGHTDEPINIRLVLDKGNSVQEIVPDVKENIYQKQIASHALSVINNTPIDGSDALHNLELVLLCHESAKKGGVFLSTELRNKK